MRVAGLLLITYTYIKWAFRVGINIRFCISFRPCRRGSVPVTLPNYETTYSGMWKNINALGLARRLLVDVSWSSPWRTSKIFPRSFPVSGWNGRLICLIELDSCKNQLICDWSTLAWPPKYDDALPHGCSHIRWEQNQTSPTNLPNNSLNPGSITWVDVSLSWAGRAGHYRGFKDSRRMTYASALSTLSK